MICSLRVDSSKPESRKRVGSFTPPVFIFYFYFSCKSTLLLVREMVSNADLQRFRLSRSGSGSPFRASRVVGRAWSRYYRAGTPSYLSSEGSARFLYRSLQNSSSRTSPVVIEIWHGLRPFPL
jgi:hypothetical protein